MIRYLLCKKYPYLELFWSVFSHIRTEYRKIASITPYSVQMRENTDQKNSEYGHFSCSNSIKTISKRLPLWMVES